MNTDTYNAIRDKLLNSADEKAAALWQQLVPTIEIDNSVPADMVRMAGNRYVRREEFLRMQRREMRRKS